MGQKQWIEEAKAKIARWDSKVSEMEARASALGEEAKAEYHKLAGRARERLGQAKADIAEAEKDGSDRWDKVKETVQRKWEENKKAFNETLDEMSAKQSESRKPDGDSRTDKPHRG